MVLGSNLGQSRALNPRKFVRPARFSGLTGDQQRFLIAPPNAVSVGGPKESKVRGRSSVPIKGRLPSTGNLSYTNHIARSHSLQI